MEYEADDDNLSFSSTATSEGDVSRDLSGNMLEEFANANLHDQSFNADIESPNALMVDADFLNDNEKDDSDVALITTKDTRPRADDHDAMKEFILTPLAEDPPILDELTYTWKLEGWTKLRRREEGPIFHCGGHPWRILFFPMGNQVEYTSVYLEHAYEPSQIPEDFASCVQFALVLWNPDAPWVYSSHVAHHRFTKEEGDWGFTRFVELRKLWNQTWEDTGHCIAEGEKANLTVYVRVVKDETGVLWHNFINYDSKKETGFVGLKNQGATCYLNSLIQSLYFTNAFRKAVYTIPTQNEESLGNSAYTLQRLFYQLQTSNNAVSTNELTKSFGWETRHIFEQQDVQELSRKLMERMETKMKGTVAENVLPKLFCGKVRTYISCINVRYESRRVEDFWDIQLNVSGNRNLEESFKDYVQVEIMNGENQYMAGDEFKLQDAEKGVIFESFPDVLHLQLKRFEYNVNQDAMMKINDRYEFPETFDAQPYLSDSADKSEPWVYQLHGVLVHSGDLNAGHYYAFIKPGKDGWFYKYDDDKVTKATMREVLEDNFGGEYLLPNGQTVKNSKSKPILRHNSAYMLVYIRQTRVDEVLLPVTKEDTPAHLQAKLDEEAALREAKRKEREEQHLYMGVKVITNDTLHANGGTELTYAWDRTSAEDPAAPVYYRILKKSTVNDLAARVGEDTGVDPRHIRFWCMVNRQNKTIRPEAPLPDPNATLEVAHQTLSGSKGVDLRLWAEVADEIDSNGDPVWPATPGIANGAALKSDLIVLFLKHFDVERQTVSCLGHVYISKEKKVEELVPLILKKMGWPEKLPNGEKVQLRLYEEIKPVMVEPLKGRQTFKAAELQDGDIVCFQLAGSNIIKSEDDQPTIKNGRGSVKAERTSSGKSERTSVTKVVPSDHYEDVKGYLEFLAYRKDIRFYPSPRNTTEYEAFNLVLSSQHNYDKIAAKVGEHLGVDPTHIRFSTVNAASGNPKGIVKRGQSQSLQTILNPPYGTFSNNNQRNDSLFFEVLDISLSELDTKKVIKVVWLSEGLSKMDTYELLIPKAGNVEDLVAALIKKAQLEDEAKAGPIRIYEVHGSKIHKELTREHQVISITDYVSVVAERIPEEDLEIDDVDFFVQAFHFQAEPSKSHGVPFRFHVIADEIFSDTKKRLEKRTGIKGKNFEKIKFAVVKRSQYASRPTYLTDDMILSDLLTADDDLLGLDHVDRSRVIRNGTGDLFLK